MDLSPDLTDLLRSLSDAGARSRGDARGLGMAELSKL